MGNPSGYGATEKEKSGFAISYQMDVKLKAKKMELWIEKEKQIGQIVTWLVECSALGPPGMEVDSYIRYGYGIDKVIETIVIASDLGLLKKSASWYTYKDEKLQGLESVHKYFSSHENEYQSLLSEVKSILSQ